MKCPQTVLTPKNELLWQPVEEIYFPSGPFFSEIIRGMTRPILCLEKSVQWSIFFLLKCIGEKQSTHMWFLAHLSKKFPESWSETKKFVCGERFKNLGRLSCDFVRHIASLHRSNVLTNWINCQKFLSKSLTAFFDAWKVECFLSNGDLFLN